MVRTTASSAPRLKAEGDPIMPKAKSVAFDASLKELGSGGRQRGIKVAVWREGKKKVFQRLTVAVQ